MAEACPECGATLEDERMRDAFGGSWTESTCPDCGYKEAR